MDGLRNEELDQLLAPYFEPDFWARLQGKVMYRARESDVPPERLELLIQSLLELGYVPHLEKRNGELFLFIVSRRKQRQRGKIWVNVFLFGLTVLSTMAAGAMLIGQDVFADVGLIFTGWQYAFAVLFILTSHEMGHYIAARRHKIDVTLPYYIPIFLPGFNLGTMGAFIKIKSPIPNRRALLDVGVAGPLAGFVVSLFFLAYGYATLPDYEGIIAYIEQIHPWRVNSGVNLALGKSILFALFNDWIGGGRLPMNEVYHFPYIFAGWIGLLVTAINLIPIGQLDGGHILYSLLGQRSRAVGLLAFFGLFILNIFLLVEYATPTWLLWIILIVILIGFRHPPTLNDFVELSPMRRILGWLCLIIFGVSFIPMPIYIQ